MCLRTSTTNLEIDLLDGTNLALQQEWLLKVVLMLRH